MQGRWGYTQFDRHRHPCGTCCRYAIGIPGISEDTKNKYFDDLGQFFVACADLLNLQPKLVS